MLEVYAHLAENVLAIPVIRGEKTPEEDFQALKYVLHRSDDEGFAKLTGGNIALSRSKLCQGLRNQIFNKDGVMSTPIQPRGEHRPASVGGVIMTHSDDDGLRLPPKIATKHIVIIPVTPKPELEAQVFEYADRSPQSFARPRTKVHAIEVIVDKRDIRGGDEVGNGLRKVFQFT